MAISSEFELIKKIREKLGPHSSATEVGIGDDTAVLKSPTGKMLATVDCLVEGVHFDLKFSSFEDVGHKALAVNLSDVAAKGGRPLYAMVSLGIRDGISDQNILDFYAGLSNLARKYGVDVVGGNCTKAPIFFADVSLIGEVQKPIFRSAGKVGDLVGVTGFLGSSAAGLTVIAQGLSKEAFSSLVAQQKRPNPRVKEGMDFSQLNGVHASIDISDGLSSELFHLSESSGVGFLIEERKLPIEKECLDLAKILGTDAYDWAWNGGEDYELLITFSSEALGSLKDRVTVIGEVKPIDYGLKRLRGKNTEPFLPKGWNHLGRI